jgi:RHS repeat-associated protein
VTDPLLRVHSFSYDELDRLNEVLTPEERSASYSYDAGGLLLERSRPATSQSLASVSSYSYDTLGRSTEVENPLGENTTLSWNVLSQLLEVSYPTEESVEYSYDAYQRLSAITASDQRSITMSYDTYDRLSEIEHSVTGSYEYSYDVLDRITQETSPDSLVTTLSYDAAGKVTEQIWNQQSTEFSYDADSRLTGIDAPGNRSYTLSYDAANRLLTETLPTTGAVDYLQDAGDRLTSQIYTLPGSLGRAPGANPSRKPSEEAELSSATSSRKLFLTAYEYARLVIGWYLREGEVRQLQKAEGGQLKGKAWEAQVALLNWWRQALLTPITIASFSPVWDAGDRITEEEIVLGQQTQERNYTYDDDDQLLSAELPSGTYSYTYDERYNRLSQRIETLSTDTTDFYTYNVADQLVERVRKDTTTQTILEEESFSYNEVGELISRTLTIGQTDATTQYAYEVGGKLKQVTLPDSSTVTYAYDALGNRIRKLSSSLDIHYQYSQGACRREIHKDPATQNTLRTITYHPWGMNILENQTSTDYYFITDFRGWVWGLTDDSGTIVESYNYDPFGKILAGSLLSHARFLSGAHEGQWDADTGLYYLGARFYDPSLGRFIQEDAIEGSADLPASQNRYVYCQNDPVALIDPTGYSPENTGTPARYNLSNLGNFGRASSTACILPDTSQYFAKGDGIWWGDDSPGEGRIWNNPFDACGEYSVVDTGRKDKQGNTIYLVTVGGVSVYISVDKNGKVTAEAGRGLTPTQQAIVKGLEDGFKNIVSRGGKLSSFNILAILQDSVTYAEKNLSTFGAMYTGSGNVIEVFFKHAVTGAAIKQETAGDWRKPPKPEPNDPEHKDKGQYDMDFGFWSSFFVERWEKSTGQKVDWQSEYLPIPDLPPGVLENERTGILGNSKIGLVDIARAMKAIMYSEKKSGILDPKWRTPDPDRPGKYAWGLMQLHDSFFPSTPTDSKLFSDLRNILNVNWKTDPFANIAGGIGHFFYHMQLGSLSNTRDNFIKGAKGYGGYQEYADYFWSQWQQNLERP